MKIFAALSAVVVAAPTYGVATFFGDEPTFTADALAAGNALTGFENFESAVFPTGAVATLSDPLQFGVPNLDGGGNGLPTGLVNADIEIQMGGGGVALAPGAFGNGTAVGGASGVSQSTTIFMTGAGIRAIGFNLFDGLNPGTVFDVTVLDASGNVIGSTTATGDIPESLNYLGIVSTVDIASVQLDAGGVAGELVDNISTYTVPTPGAAALLGLGGLAAVRRRR